MAARRLYSSMIQGRNSQIHNSEGGGNIADRLKSRKSSIGTSITSESSATEVGSSKSNSRGGQKHDSDLFNVVRTLACVYLAVSIPLRLAFIPQFRITIKDIAQVAFILLDLISTALFTADAIRNYHRNRGQYLTEARIAPLANGKTRNGNKSNSFMISGVKRRSTRKTPFGEQYPSFVFGVSILSALPLEYCTIFLKNGGIDVTRLGFSMGWANYLLMNRFLIIWHLPWYLEDLAAFLEARRIVKNIGIQRAWKLFFAMAIAGHWCCCGFFLVGKSVAINPHSMMMSWPEDLGLLEIIRNKGGEGAGNDEVGVSIAMLVSTPAAYIQSLYWAYITMITTGFGDIVPLALSETLWCILSMAIGVIITTSAIANLQLLVTNADAAFVEFQQKKETIRKYMRYRRLPTELQNRIMAFYQYSWDLLKGADEARFVEELPSSLQQQVANFMCRDLIASLPFLRSANTSLLNALAECVEINIYSPKDEILKKGENIRGAILVSRGEVEVLSGFRVERKMRRLDNFAADTLFDTKKSDRTVRARTFCEVFLLPADGFQQSVNSQCDKEHIRKMQETASMMSRNASKANKLFGSAEDVVQMNNMRKHFYPSSKFRTVWDLVKLLGHIFYVFSTPVMVMRYLEGASFETALISFIFCYLVDAFFLLDLFLSVNAFMHHEEGIVIFDRGLIREKWFQDQSYIREITAALPLDLLAIMLPARLSFLLRLNKLARLPDFMKSLDKLDVILKDLNLNAGLALLNVAKLNLALLVTCHVVGCLWHGCADIGQSMGFSMTWRIADEEDVTLAIDHSDLNGFGSYLRSVYWAIVGMSTVGYGDIVPTNIFETTFAAVVLLFGGLILPAIVGGLAAYLGNLNQAERAHRRKITRVKQYMRHRFMKQGLIDKVMNYYDYLWSRQGAIDEMSVLNELPIPLRQEVLKHVNIAHIDALPFLQDSDTTMKNLLSSVMKPRVFMPNNAIVTSGEVGSSMYFIERGKAAIVKDGGLITFTLEKGCHFGEGALLSAKRHTSSVVALAYCDVFELSKEDFHEILDECVSHSRKEAILHMIRASLFRYMRIHRNVLQNMTERKKCNKLVSLDRINPTIDKASVNLNSSQHSVRYSPDSATFAIWNLLMCGTILYNAWVLPYRAAFSSSQNIQWIDWIFDLFLLIDMYLNYEQVAYVHEGEVIFDRSKVHQHYIKSRFVYDSIATLPLDIIYVAVNTNALNPLALMFLRSPRILWLVRLPNIVNRIFRVIEDHDIDLTPLKLIEFLSGVILIAHWAGCGFYAFARWKNHASDCTSDEISDAFQTWSGGKIECQFDDTWIMKQVLNGKLPIDGGEPWQHYIRSFNWALPTLVVVVIGDVVPVTMNETLYAFAWMVIGVSINGMIIGNVANIVTHVDTDSSSFAKKADEMKKFISGRVSSSLRNRVGMFISEFWDHREAYDGESFLSDLPATLQVEVTEKTRHWHISHCPFFDFCSVDIVKALSLRLKLMLFSKEDEIVNDGDLGSEMYFLEKGTVEVVDASSNTILATLTSEDDADHGERTSVFFGETSLFFKRRRRGTVRAVTFCEVYQLKKVHLDEELLQRDFDLSRMLEIFTDVADSNDRRNQAVKSNLLRSRNKSSKLSKMMDPDESFRRRRKVREMFLPNSTFRIMWDFMSVLFTIYFAIEIPYRATFVYDQDFTKVVRWIIVDTIIDIYFITDILLRLYFLPLTQNGILIVDLDQIRKHYAGDGLLVDIFASLPIDFVGIGIGIYYLPHLRLIHMARIFRFPSYMSQIESYLNLFNLRLSAATGLLLKMISYYFVVVHWFGCIWFALHRYLEARVKYTWATTDCPGDYDYASDGCLSSWNENMGRHDICHGASIGRCYTRSVYFVLTTMSTVGYGDISPMTEVETIFQNVVVLTGACFFAGIIGSFGEFLSQNDKSGTSAFKTKLQKLKEYMNYRELPKQLQEEVLFFHQTKWDRSHVLNEKEVRNMLPDPLQMEISFEMLGGVINKFPILNESSLLLRKRICGALSLQMCPASSIIYNAGDIGWDIYFIGAGLVKIDLPQDLSILDEEGKANASRIKDKAAAVGLLYRQGNHFGESALSSLSGVRQESVTAKTVAELYFLSKEKLDEIFQFTSIEERSKLRRNLQSRNGNVWHYFDDDDESNSDSSERRDELQSSYKNSRRISSLHSRSSSLCGWAKPQRKSSMVQSSQSFNTETARRLRRNTRLRSFSAQAMGRAIPLIDMSKNKRDRAPGRKVLEAG